MRSRCAAGARSARSDPVRLEPVRHDRIHLVPPRRALGSGLAAAAAAGLCGGGWTHHEDAHLLLADEAAQCLCEDSSHCCKWFV